MATQQSHGGTATVEQAVHPQQGDRYHCSNCNAEVQVTQSCNCKDPCSHFTCCGQPMQKR